MAGTLTISDTQMTALVSAGIFEAAETEDELALAAAISGNRLDITDRERLARIVCDLSNNSDELARDLSGDGAAWARQDSRALTSLYSKILRAA